MKALRKELVINNIIFIVIIGLFFLSNIHELDMITILNDEFGYWGNAAVIVGNDWSSLLKETPYYSVGYSLILIPIIKFIDNTQLLYQTAVFLNMAMIIGTFNIVYYLAKNLFGIVDSDKRFWISMLSTLNMSVLFQSQVAWAETLITLLTVLIAFSLYKMENKITPLRMLFLGGLILFSIITHRRMLPIVLVAILFGAIIIISKKSYRNIMFYVIIIFSVFVLFKLITYWHTSICAPSIENSTMNNKPIMEMASTYYSLLMSKLMTFINSLIGKYVATNFSTFTLLPVVFYSIISEVRKRIGNDVNIHGFYTRSYIVISFIVIFILTSIQMMGGARKDYVVYTRYFDNYIVLIILYGFSVIITNGYKYTKYLIYIFGTYIVFLFYTYLQIGTAEGDFNMPCSPALGGLYQFYKKNGHYIQVEDSWILVLKVSVIFLICVLIIANYNSKKIFYLVGVILFSITILNSANSNDWLKGCRDSFRSNTKKISVIIKEDNESIYFVKKENQDDSCVRPKYLQYLLYDRSIEVEDDIEMIPSKSWVLSDIDYDLQNKYDNLDTIYSSDMLILYKKQ